MPVDADTFRSVLGRFASGVTIVTTVGRDSEDQGMTVSSFCSVSLEPPLVLICIDRAATMYDSLAVAPQFIVQVLSESQEAIARRFSNPGSNRFEGIGYVRSAGGIAILDDILAYIECRRVGAHQAGDHCIYIGEVEEAVTYEGRPLLYYRSGYAQLER